MLQIQDNIKSHTLGCKLTLVFIEVANEGAYGE